MKNRELLKHFIGPIQLLALDYARRGAEGPYFKDLVARLGHVFATMPQIYQQHSEDATAHLHYFRGGSNWYITERDTSDEQLQAFGLADLFGDCAELGYISIQELIGNGAELDLHFVPTPLSQLKTA